LPAGELFAAMQAMAKKAVAQEKPKVFMAGS
jgi:hypothetical protein